MARYYNTTRGPIPLSLSGNRSMSIPPKSWVELDAKDETTAALIAEVKKGHLVRSRIA